MATGYGVCVNIEYEQRAISYTGFRQRTGPKQYRDRVRITYGTREVIVQSPQPSHGNGTEPV